MVLINGFRYGEISRKQAGRFAEDGYNQGCFRFENAMTLYDTGMTRRYPLRTVAKINSNTKIYVIQSFTLSNTEAYIVGIGDKEYNGERENCILIWKYLVNQNKWELEVSIEDHNKGNEPPIFAIDNGYDDVGNRLYSPTVLSEDICKSIRFAQYYDRLYVCSKYFRTFYITNEEGVNWATRLIEPITNKNAKSNVFFVKGGSGDGIVVFQNEKDGYFYTSLDFTEQYVTKDDEILVKADKTYISGFDDYGNNDDLNNGVGTYPSVIAVVNDSLYLANTDKCPATFWKSRVLGTSQWIGEDNTYSAESMHDFCEFDVIATTKTSLKDSAEWPLTQETDMYEVSGGEELWYAPNTNFTRKLIRTPKYYYQWAMDDCFYYYEGTNTRYEFSSSAEMPIKIDGQWYKPDKVTRLDRVTIREDYPFSATPSMSEVRANDYTWAFADSYPATTITVDGQEIKLPPVSKNESYQFADNDKDKFPVKKPIYNYDLSDANSLFYRETTIDFVTTDSCGVRLELNTGKDDAIVFISGGCGKIIIGTSTCYYTLPANFSAVSNKYASTGSYYGALQIEPIKLGRSFFFFQTGRLIRELYLDDGYIVDKDVTAMNHDMFKYDIVDAVEKGTPDPSIVSVLDNGTIVQVTYDRNGGLNSMAKWYSGTLEHNHFMFKSLANIRINTCEKLYTLVKDENIYYICEFYEPSEKELSNEETRDLYYDEVGENKYPFDTFIETVYAEVYDNSLAFGARKKATGMYIRPYLCGHLLVGNDERQLHKTNYRLENNDEYIQIYGKAERQFSMKIKSCDAEPMMLLALSWETR